jgi:Cys-rich repeat protein
MTTEKISSQEENQDASESLQASSEPPPEKQCTHDGDCPSGQSCVNGVCQ